MQMQVPVLRLQTEDDTKDDKVKMMMTAKQMILDLTAQVTRTVNFARLHLPACGLKQTMSCMLLRSVNQSIT